MNTTVNQMVSQYIAFYESKDKSTDRSQPSTAIWEKSICFYTFVIII